MPKRNFDKPPKTYREQVRLLQERGMVVENPEEAEFYLQHLNYYRLSAYWIPFQRQRPSHDFRPGTRFSRVLNLYVFDRELRLLVLDAIERTEISVRSHWAYTLAHRHGAHAHLDVALAREKHRWQQNVEALKKETERSYETFVVHHKNTYAEDLPPVWAVCEIMSLGQLSHWYSNLKPMGTRGAIARVYDPDERVLQSWLHHLTHIRNLSAHHSRLWNRSLSNTPEQPRTKPAGLNAQWQRRSRKLYNTLVIILHFMNLIAPNHHWRKRFKELLARQQVDPSEMGFPTAWENMPIWTDQQR